MLQVYLDVTMFLGDGRSKQEKLESLLSIPDRVSEEGKSEGFSILTNILPSFPQNYNDDQGIIFTGEMSKQGSRRSSEVSAREKSEEESKKVHPFIRAILKKEKSEEIAKEIIDAHHEDERREIKPGEQDVGKEINKITENMIEVTDYLGSEVPENIRHVEIV